MDEGSDLEPAVRELADTLEDLRSELTAPPEGPFGLPRPPAPRELLRLTEQYTIPATVAVLETNIRLLELLAAAIRVADGRPLDAAAREEDLLPAGGGLAAAGRYGADGLAAASRATLQRLDDALAELQTAAEGGAPDDPELQRLLAEARSLRAAVDEQLSAAGDDGGSPPADRTSGESADDGDPAPPDDAAAGGPVDVDVEEELETLRRQSDRPDPDDGGETDNEG